MNLFLSLNSIMVISLFDEIMIEREGLVFRLAVEYE